MNTSMNNMNDMMTEHHDVAHASRVDLAFLAPAKRAALPQVAGSFIDMAGTATARGTFYNTKAEQQAAIEAVHAAMFDIDRTLYAAALMLPGTTDHTRQLGVARLLATGREGHTLLTTQQEHVIVRELCHMLPPQRLLKMFAALATQRVNNARTRRVMLTAILGAKPLELWSVKYRSKVRAALVHAWGQRTASILAAILGKPADQRTDRERSMLRRQIDRFAKANDVSQVHACVRFALGVDGDPSLPLHKAFVAAKVDFAAGATLPLEVLEGIRSRYHPDLTSKAVLEVAKDSLSAGQQMAVQRRAAEADVEVAFDPKRYDAPRLYRYAFEMGMTDAIRAALLDKAAKVAADMPVRFAHVGVLVDTSASMAGDLTQKHRPISIALAMRDMLCAAADDATSLTANGRHTRTGDLAQPTGDTSLGASLVRLLATGADVVFVLSDGYENAPAGLVGQVVRAARQIGITTPVFHASPVFAAEASGVRSLGELVPTMPVSEPAGLATTLVKAMLDVDLERGIAALLQMTVPRVLQSLPTATPATA